MYNFKEIWENSVLFFKIIKMIEAAKSIDTMLEYFLREWL